jgi:beta-lactamase class D
MPRFIRLCTALVVLTMLSPTLSAAPPTKDAATQTAAARFADYGHPGTFLLQRDGAAPQILHDDAWAATPLRPASTFKVMLSLVALETGTLRSADEVVKWDGKRYPSQPGWQKDMALREAMQTSSENYFGTLATRIGHQRLAEWVQRVGYGNGRVGSNPPRIWHDAVLTVTAQQQLAFIDRLRRGDLPFSAKTIATVKAAMLDSEIGGQRIYGKTGTHFDDGTGNAWWIGWVEGGKAPAASFVLGVQLKKMDKRDARIALGKQLLRDADALR